VAHEPTDRAAAPLPPDRDAGPGSTGETIHRREVRAVPVGVRMASEWAWRLIVIGAAIYLAANLLGMLAQVVVPIIVAVLLAALLHPVSDTLRRVLPASAAAAITVLGTLAGIIGLLSFVGAQLGSQFNDLVSQVGEGVTQIRTWVSDTFGLSDTQLADYYDQVRQAVGSSDSLRQTATQAGLTATHVVAGFFIALFALFFFLYDGSRIWGWVVRLFPSGVRAQVVSSGRIAWGQLGSFTRATILVAAADAIGIGAGAAVLGVPFASGIALLVFFGAFIPIVGALVSGAVAVLLALVSKGFVTALIMLGVVIAVQQLEAHVLQPVLLGRAVRVHPLAVILAIAAGVILGGIVGALIAVPTAAVVNAVGHHLLDPVEVDQDQDSSPPEQRPGVQQELAEGDIVDES
jgi:predicted PurR-regulated permease PerM